MKVQRYTGVKKLAGQNGSILPKLREIKDGEKYKKYQTSGPLHSQLLRDL